MFDVPQQFSPVASLIPSSAADVLRIVIAADPATRETLGSVAGTFDDLLVLDELAADGMLAARLRVLTPDVLLFEPGRSDDLTPLAAIATPALVLAGSPLQRSAAVTSGARGVIDRGASPRRIHAALRAVGEGLRVVDAGMPGDLRSSAVEPLDEPLTARERDVLQLLTAGKTNKEIAHHLGITEHTVKFHVNAILGKLGADTRTQAVVTAARRGIVVL